MKIASNEGNRGDISRQFRNVTIAKMTIVAAICGCVQFLTSCGPVAGASGMAMANGGGFQGAPNSNTANFLGAPEMKESSQNTLPTDTPTAESTPDISVDTALDQQCVATGVDASLTKVCQLVNQQRSQQKDAPLKIDAKLSAVAQAFAQDMTNKNYFSHTAPDGTTMQMRFGAGGVSFMWAGENIAEGQPDANAVVTAWMNSPGHRANILQDNYHKIGLGRVGVIWVQEFSD